MLPIAVLSSVNSSASAFSASASGASTSLEPQPARATQVAAMTNFLMDTSLPPELPSFGGKEVSAFSGSSLDEFDRHGSGFAAADAE